MHVKADVGTYVTSVFAIKVVLQYMKTVLSVAHTQLLFRQAGMACYLSIGNHLSHFKCQYSKFSKLIIGSLQQIFKVIFLLRL